MQYLTFFAAMFSIQAGASLAKKVFPVLGAEGTTLYRLFFASVILCTLNKPWRIFKKITAAELRSIFIYGVSLAGMNLLFYLSIERIPLGISVAIEFTGPLALAIWFSRKPLDFLWTALAATGILLLVPQNTVHASEKIDLLGATYSLSAGVFWALYILAGRKASTTTSITVKGAIAVTGAMVTATALVLPFAVVTAGSKLLHLEILPIAIGVAILSSALPYSLDLYTLKRINPKNFSILLSLAPACAALSGLLFLGETLVVRQWMAILCVVAASLGTAVSKKRSNTTIQSA